MKSILLNNEDVTVADLTDSQRKKLSFERRPGRALPVPFFKKGTEFEGDFALHLVKTGQAAPSDEECRKACGLTEQQLAKLGRVNSAALVGITGEKDTAMFLAGAIEGYGPGSTDENPVYIKGPNWDAWHEAANEVTKESTKDPLNG